MDLIFILVSVVAIIIMLFSFFQMNKEEGNRVAISMAAALWMFVMTLIIISTVPNSTYTLAILAYVASFLVGVVNVQTKNTGNKEVTYIVFFILHICVILLVWLG